MKKLKNLRRSTWNGITSYAIVIIGYVIMQILISGGNITASLKGQLIPICAYIVMALSLNLTVGVLGELSLGHAGFVSVGAFVGAIVCIGLEGAVESSTLRLIIAMVIGAVSAGIAGLLIGIPVLRLKGDYLAIVTLAFGEIIKTLVMCLYVGKDAAGLHFGFLLKGGIEALGMGEGARTIINGPMGVVGVRRISTFTVGFALIIVSLFIIQNLVNSRSGRAIMALRDNRIAAESVGIPVTKYKLMAFVTSAALAGAAGTLYSMNFSTTLAAKFNFNTSILILVFVVLGGLGKMWGSILATIVLLVLPEILRGLNDYRMLIYAIALIFVMIITNNSKIIHWFVMVWTKIFKKNPKTSAKGVS